MDLSFLSAFSPIEYHSHLKWIKNKKRLNCCEQFAFAFDSMVKNGIPISYSIDFLPFFEDLLEAHFEMMKLNSSELAELKKILSPEAYENKAPGKGERFRLKMNLPIPAGVQEY